MSCCGRSALRSAHDHDAYHRQTSDELSGFPGNRRFVKTGGNALAAAPPQQPHNNYQQQNSTNHYHPQSSGNAGDIVSVTVPPGVSPGQSIEVRAPDGSGRSVMAVVPQGMTAGSSFMVQFPPNATPSPAPSVVAATVASAPQPTDHVDYSKVTPMPPPVEPFAQAVPVGSAPGATTISAMPNSASPMPFGEPMLRVQVPPGTPPGTTIHVQVPGENRTIQAQVPPGGVSSFHVPYQQQSPPAIAPVPPLGEKLLLVRVPPGVLPGSTLHVNIPDEPGRVIAATVPPNVSEFHVSYQPQNPQQSGQPRNAIGYPSHNGPRNSYPNNNLPRNSYQNRNDNNGYQNNNRNQNNESGIGSMLLPALGGAALGMVGMSIFDHNRNNGYNNDGNAYADNGGGDYNDANAYADAPSDYYGGGDDYGGGGGDWGGTDDYGGDYGGGDMDFGGFSDF